MNSDSAKEWRELLSDSNKMRHVTEIVYMFLKSYASKAPATEHEIAQQMLAIWEPFLLNEERTYEDLVLRFYQSARIFSNLFKEGASKIFGGENYIEKAAESVVEILPLKFPRDTIFSVLIEKMLDNHIDKFFCSRTNLDQAFGEEFKDVADLLYEFFTFVELKKGEKPFIAFAEEGEKCDFTNDIFGDNLFF
jgi:hypothetical protein